MAPAADIDQVASQRPPMDEMRRGAVTGLAIVVVVVFGIWMVSSGSRGFSEGVQFVQSLGVLILVLLLSVPIGAICAILRGRRNRLTGRSLFPHLVLWAWVLLAIGAVFYFFPYRWYGEGSLTSPQETAAQAIPMAFGVLVLVAGIHIGLYRTTQPMLNRKIE